ncbi:MAG: hypothetical protein LAT51_13255 [Flavobacteriaceae bacterium]|nr:hypothetical protein [Flavobacteriaceae bacterium]
MKKHYLLLLAGIILVSVFTSYYSKTEKKQKFIYENGNQKIEIKILSGNDYLEYNKPIRTNFELTNITASDLMIVGRGVRFLGSENGNVKTQIKVKNNDLESDTLAIRVRFGEQPEENHEFLVL